MGHGRPGASRVIIIYVQQSMFKKISKIDEVVITVSRS